MHSQLKHSSNLIGLLFLVLLGEKLYLIMKNLHESNYRYPILIFNNHSKTTNTVNPQYFWIFSFHAIYMYYIIFLLVLHNNFFEVRTITILLLLILKHWYYEECLKFMLLIRKKLYYLIDSYLTSVHFLKFFLQRTLCNKKEFQWCSNHHNKIEVEV